MAVEEKRILKMIYLLSRTDSYLKAGELARELNISERTVKNDIDHLREACRNCGCNLKSVRGKGYILEIRDTERFAQTREWINILFNNVEKDVKQNQSYQLARAIMCGQTEAPLFMPQRGLPRVSGCCKQPAMTPASTTAECRGEPLLSPKRMLRTAIHSSCKIR